jgi:hypothetical protein
MAVASLGGTLWTRDVKRSPNPLPRAGPDHMHRIIMKSRIAALVRTATSRDKETVSIPQTVGKSHHPIVEALAGRAGRWSRCSP